MPPRSTGLSRRAFLAGTAGAALLAACGDDDGDAQSDPGTSTEPTDGGGLVLASFFNPAALTFGAPQRLPVGIADAEGVFLSEPPGTLTFSITGDGPSLAESVTVSPRTEGLSRHYYPIVFEPPAAGTYVIGTEVEGETITTRVPVPATTPTLGVGATLPARATPTVADQQGVELLCTREPAPCPWHDVTLTDALAEGRPMALLIATPAFCQIAVCGPVLDILLDASADFPGIRYLHSEVYPTQTAAQGNQTVVPLITDLGLGFEPVLYLARAGGTIVDRIDVIFDRTEVAEALDRLT